MTCLAHLGHGIHLHVEHAVIALLLIFALGLVSLAIQHNNTKGK